MDMKGYLLKNDFGRTHKISWSNMYTLLVPFLDALKSFFGRRSSDVLIKLAHCDFPNIFLLPPSEW